MTRNRGMLPTHAETEETSAGRKINRRQLLTQTATAGLGFWVLGCGSQPVGNKSWGAAGSARERIGVKEVSIKDVEHNIVFYDKTMYSAHVNRCGLWNFGDGEIVVAHMVNTECPYDGPQWVNHNYKMPTTGVMLHRSFDNGKTWPESESRKWIWNNDRTEEELIGWDSGAEEGSHENRYVGTRFDHAPGSFALCQLTPCSKALSGPLYSQRRPAPKLGKQTFGHYRSRSGPGLPGGQSGLRAVR